MPHQTALSHHGRPSYPKSHGVAYWEQGQSYPVTQNPNIKRRQITHHHSKQYSTHSHYDYSRCSYRTYPHSYHRQHNQYTDYYARLHSRNSRPVEYRDQEQVEFEKSYHVEACHSRSVPNNKPSLNKCEKIQISTLQHDQNSCKKPCCDDDINESAEEAAVSALLLSAGGSRNSQFSDPREQDNVSNQNTKTFSDSKKVNESNVDLQASQEKNMKQQDSEKLCIQKTVSQIPPIPSTISDGPCNEKTTTPAAMDVSHFPSTLHKILTSSKFLGTVLEWLPHGQAWRVLRWDELAKSVLPVFFPSMCLDDESNYGERMNCFLWHVRSWGFQEVKDIGPDMGAYWHNCFIKDNESLCHQMHPYPSGRFVVKGRSNEKKLSAGVPQKNSMHSSATSGQETPLDTDSNCVNSDEKKHSCQLIIKACEKEQEMTTPRRDKSKDLNLYHEENSVVSTSPIKQKKLSERDPEFDSPRQLQSVSSRCMKSNLIQASRTLSWSNSHENCATNNRFCTESGPSHFTSSQEPNHYVGIVPQSPSNDTGNYSQRLYYEPVFSEQILSQERNLSIPYSAPIENSFRSPPNQVSPERSFRGDRQRLRSGRGGARVFVSSKHPKLESRCESENQNELITSQGKRSVFSVSTRGKGTKSSNCLRRSSSSISDHNFHSVYHTRGLEMCGSSEVHLTEGKEITHGLVSSAAIAISRKSKRQRLN